MSELTYEQTIELQENIKIKDDADKLYANFLEKVKLNVSTFKNGKFCIWSDSHNATYIFIKDDNFVFECRFLHEHYLLTITPSSLFMHIKNKYRGLDHFRSALNQKY